MTDPIMTDPIIEEIWKFRQEHAARFNDDIGAILEDFRRTEEAHKAQGRQYVTLPPNRLAPSELGAILFT